MNGDAVREVRQHAVHIHAHRVLGRASVRVIIGNYEVLASENTAVFQDTRIVGALVNCLLKDILVPAVIEVAVEAVTCWIACREDKVATCIELVEGVDAEVNLVEDGDQMDRVR